MAVNKLHNQYFENSINTATHEELTLMLYNGLVKFIMIAQSGMEEKNHEKANANILRAQDIINEFRATLDMKFEVSKGLDSLYEYMNRRLIEANIRKDKEILEEVLGMAKELRDTWSLAIKRAKSQPAKKTIENCI
jgi:flagellar protein FliS